LIEPPDLASLKAFSNENTWIGEPLQTLIEHVERKFKVDMLVSFVKKFLLIDAPYSTGNLGERLPIVELQDKMDGIDEYNED
jgi:hypothetical protein